MESVFIMSEKTWEPLLNRENLHCRARSQEIAQKVSWVVGSLVAEGLFARLLLVRGKAQVHTWLVLALVGTPGESKIYRSHQPATDENCERAMTE